MKLCKKCDVEKQDSEFYLDYKGKLRSYCKPCWSAYSVAHQQKNHDKYFAKKQQYQQEHKDYLREVRREWRKNNPDKVKAIHDRTYAKKKAKRELEKSLIPIATDKQCYSCKVRKPFTEFNKKTTSKDGLSGYCRECAKEKLRKFFNENKDKTRSYQTKYRSNNSDKVNAYNAKAKIIRRKLSVPSWVDKEELKKFYTEAKRLTQETGIKHHVDHIVPLKHKDVCGLHVPWNLQVITMTENVSKRNKFEESLCQ